MDNALETKIRLLRSLEGHGYAIAYYLLQNETLAEEATRAALLEAGCDDRLREWPAEAQREKFARLVMSQAIAAKREWLLRQAE
ncbi:hypothetical protein [Cohnella hongkongensis]|uniref:Uncharacterized protein n=1 Tax=Cohnella hongkongensis TaxID=178337 RepID=A0ABV9FJQ5_9BACL